MSENKWPWTPIIHRFSVFPSEAWGIGLSEGKPTWCVQFFSLLSLHKRLQASLRSQALPLQYPRRSLPEQTGRDADR